jgi:hypothetical protein
LFADGEIVKIPAEHLRVEPGGPALSYAEAQLALSQVSDEAAEDAWRAALDSVTCWSWDVAVRPLLRVAYQRGLHHRDSRALPRLVLVPSGLLGAVPWHAAWTSGEAGERTYACREAVFSYAASARQLVDVSGRTRLPLDADPVFVADPTGLRHGATFQTLALRTLLYPRSRGYGKTGRADDPEGTPEQVLDTIPGRESTGASLLQLSCHGASVGTPMASYLQLAGPTSDPSAGRLDVGRILHRAYGRVPWMPGGLVVLAACVSDMTPGDYDEALTLSTALLASGAVSVVGSRWEISGRVTPVLMFMFHRFLVQEEMNVPDALQATQAWMLDSNREVPPDMPPVIREGMATHDCTDIAVWGAFTCQGQ